MTFGRDGRPSWYFSHIPLIALAVITAAPGVASPFTEGHLGSGMREDRSNRWVIEAPGVLGFTGAYLPAYSSRHDILTCAGLGPRFSCSATS
jgi:hypothetical protein